MSCKWAVGRPIPQQQVSCVEDQDCQDAEFCHFGLPSTYKVDELLTYVKSKYPDQMATFDDAYFDELDAIMLQQAMGKNLTDWNLGDDVYFDEVYSEKSLCTPLRAS